MVVGGGTEAAAAAGAGAEAKLAISRGEQDSDGREPPMKEAPVTRSFVPTWMRWVEERVGSSDLGRFRWT